MKKYSCFIFDLDGTLMDTSEGILRSVEETLQELNIPIPEEAVLKTFIGPPIYESFQKHCGMNPEQCDIATDMFRNIYKDKHLLLAETYSGVFPLLKYLKKNNVKLAVATNKRYDYAYDLLKHYSFTDYFDCIEGTDFENKLKKTDVIQNCLKKLNMLAEKSVMVGDSSSDSKGANNCQMDFIAVTYGFGYKKGCKAEDVGATFVVDCVSELENICKNTYLNS